MNLQTICCDECELYNSCGANARCNISAANRCNCLDGFDGDLSRHQQSSLWERRCVRRKGITCTDDGDDFLKIERVRFISRDFAVSKAEEDVLELPADNSVLQKCHSFSFLSLGLFLKQMRCGGLLAVCRGFDYLSVRPKKRMKTAAWISPSMNAIKN
ncbi:hypothetical protein ACLOJK_003179 [Asimina triloba]